MNDQPTNHSRTGPIAIVGASCRFPGGCNDLASYWRLLCEGRDAIREIPADRWDIDAFFDADPDRPEKVYSRWGAFLDNIDLFDPEFFGISPREAVRIDPQQRLLAELAWESLENAGHAPASLANTRTGVFIGISHSDYLDLQLRSGVEIDAFSGIGSALSVAANRLSYLLNVHGPSLSIDTACSSSAVAIHWACESLRSGESEIALAGGIHAILVPDATIAFCKARMLSPEGRCKTFDADANGYVRGEGGGLIVLKRLDDALAADDSILAIIRGSAVNHNGRSNGLASPSGLAQQQVIRTALENGGVRPEQISYIEAHGTGTQLGDAIELESLSSVFDKNHSADHPLYVGSVKTNIGHLEPASGIAGILKAALVLKHGIIPPHLNVTTPNPVLVRDGTTLRVPMQTCSIETNRSPRYAGVNSFGFGGANAHLVLQQPPEPPPTKPFVERPCHVFAFSARVPQALKQLAKKYDRHLAEHPEIPLADAAFTVNTGRTHFSHRAVVVARSHDQMRERLSMIAAGQTSPLCHEEKVTRRREPKIAFLFTGQGAQHAGMARDLLETQPTFRKALLECERCFSDYLDVPLLSLFELGPEMEARLAQTGYTQPVLFALEYALSEMWRSWGVVPHAVLGHSLGEYAAACAAGLFSLEDGARLVAKRAAMMQRLPTGGAMAAVLASRDVVARALADNAKEAVAIASINGPESVVITGDESGVLRLCEAFNADGIHTKHLVTSHAFHSHHMDRILDELEEAADSVAFATPKIPLVSNLTGQVADPRDLANPSYWAQHARNPVLFADSMQAVNELGCELFLEIGPHPVLLGMGRPCLPDVSATWLPSLRRGHEDWEIVLDTLARIYTAGVNIDWQGFDADYVRRGVVMPTYPFQRHRYWPANPNVARGGGDLMPSAGGPSHPLLGNEMPTAVDQTIYQSTISAESPSLLADHIVLDTVIVPGAAYLDMGLTAARDKGSDDGWILHDLAFTEPLILAEDETYTLQTVVEELTHDKHAFRVASLGATVAGRRPQFTIHASGCFRERERTFADPPPVDLASLQARFTGETHDRQWQIDTLTASGMERGPSFSWIDEVRIEGNEAIGNIRNARPEDHLSDYHAHPGLIDTGFQLLGTLLPDTGSTHHAFVLARIEQVLVFSGQDTAAAWWWCDLTSADDGKALGNIRLLGANGEVLAELTGVEFHLIARDWLERLTGAASKQRRMYEIQWQPQPLSETARSAAGDGRWLILDQRQNLGLAVAQQLTALGHSCHVVPAGTSGEQLHTILDEQIRDHNQTPVVGIVHFGSLDAVASPDSSDNGELDLESAARSGWGSVLDLIHALHGNTQSVMPKLWLITRGARVMGGAAHPMALEQSMTSGLARVIAVERPDLACRHVDLDPTPYASEAEALANELVAGDDEDQTALRRGVRYVPRLLPYDRSDVGSLKTPEGESFRLEITHRGELDNVELRHLPRRRPGPGEVEIRVHATGLNFRDVLNLLDLYPGDAGLLGGECAGEVVAVGEGIKDLSPGDAVVALAPGSFASHVVTLADFVTPMPRHLSFEQAASLPIALLTAQYALGELGNMQRGDRVLIHSATGGVGMAAVQLAQKAGAEVFATAGSEKKRDVLRALGIHHVMDSRSHDFADEIMDATDGQGVQLVLNSLAGEAISKGVACVAPGGHFLEIGKNDVWDQKRVDEFKPGITFHAIALDGMMAADPQTVGRLLRDTMQAVIERSIEPLPLRTFPLSDVVGAFRYLARAEHIGKIAVRFDDAETDTPSLISPADKGTYLITGGLGALGLDVAERLTQRGARHLVLAGRSLPTPTAIERISQLKQDGVNVITVQADVAKREAVARMLADIDESMPPLRGIIHAAGVIDDGLLGDQTHDRFRDVMGPKVQGAWNLHMLTRDIPLDMFVMFSSAAAMLGSPGQGSYAAANAFLDALAHQRRYEGRCGTSINWGPWGEHGMAAKVDEAERQRWTASGIHPFATDQALQLFEQAIVLDRSQVGMLPIEWPKFLARHPAGNAPWWADLGRSAGATIATEAGELVRQLEEVTPGERLDVAIDYICRQVLRVIGADDSFVADPLQSFAEMGFDSLMAVELGGVLGRAIDRPISPTLFLDYPNMRSLAIHLVEDVYKSEATGDPALAVELIAETTSSKQPPPSESMIDRIEDLSDEKAGAMLDDEIAKLLEEETRE